MFVLFACFTQFETVLGDSNAQMRANKAHTADPSSFMRSIQYADDGAGIRPPGRQKASKIIVRGQRSTGTNPHIADAPNEQAWWRCAKASIRTNASHTVIPWQVPSHPGVLWKKNKSFRWALCTFALCPKLPSRTVHHDGKRGWRPKHQL